MEQEVFNRDFKGVWIPKEVWLDNRLSALDKIILTEIDSLDQGEEGCFASNEYIANFCQCSSTKVSTSISKLVDYEYIYVLKFDGRKRHLKSRLTKNNIQTLKKCKSDLQNFKHINIDNKTNNNINNKERKKKTGYDEIIDSKISDNELKDLIYEFIKMRKMKKKPLTDRALTIQINKLLKLSDDIRIQKKIVEKSIVKCWDEFYEYKDKLNKDDSGVDILDFIEGGNNE